jgi:homoprotocatechuate degradation regulator HpaR
MALLRAREAVMERFRPLLRRHGVTEQQWRVLRALSASAETSASALSATTCIGLPSLSRILRTLEGRGLLTRRVKSTDLRTTLVSLSPAGTRLLRKAGSESERRYESLAAEIGEANMKQLYSLLDRVASARTGGTGDGRTRTRSTP